MSPHAPLVDCPALVSPYRQLSLEELYGGTSEEAKIEIVLYFFCQNFFHRKCCL